MENERNQENGERFLLPFEYIIEMFTDATFFKIVFPMSTNSADG